MARAARQLRLPARRGSWQLDLVIAVVASTFLVLVSGHIPVPSDRHGLDALGFVALGAAGASMGALRRAPGVSLTVATLVLTFFIVRDYPNGPVWLTGLVSLFALSWRASRRTALLSAAAVWVILEIANGIAGDAPLLLPLLYVGWSVAVVFIADALRNRRSYLTQLEERAQFLEQTREEEARRRVAEERVRIARDLHDSVAHAMATINVQAGAAAHVLERRPEAAQEALLAIQRASGDVLDELGAMLTLLRDVDESAERAPTPGIGEIPQLASSMNGAGLDVSLVVEGDTHRTSAPVGTAAYRVVQESLTNVVRHANARRARVIIRADGDRGLCVEVVDDGTGSSTPASRTGHGIRGMRERVAATGGRLSAGPVPSGGFAVRATWDGAE
jgi:signal transduction histidine kinase